MYVRVRSRWSLLLIQDPAGGGDNFGGRNPTCLDCSGSNLSSFEPDAVFALIQRREQTIPRSLDDIKMIDISNNSIPRLPRGFAKTFNNVAELNIRNNRSGDMKYLKLQLVL